MSTIDISVMHYVEAVTCILTFIFCGKISLSLP